MRSKQSLPDRVLATISVNGEQCPVTNMFDAFGEDTQVREEACSAVVLLPDGKWKSIDVTGISLWPLQ